MAERVRSERNQGRAEDMDLLEHDRIGFNYRLTDLQAAIGIAQLERLEGILRGRERLSLSYRARLTELGALPPGESNDDALLLPCEDRGAERRSWFVFCVQLPIGTNREAVIEELGRRGVAAKAYLPCIHLMPPYRERFGIQEGQFPVAERVAARSLALPFFSSMTEEDVDRVCTVLGHALGLST
jgi:perosamine synthetase